MKTMNRNLRLLGKGVLGLLSRADLTATLSVLSLAAMPAVVLASPDGEQVVRGDVRFERRGNETWITAGRNSIINYRSFNIAGNETVRFIQPDAASRVLNRVTSAAPTRIDGSLLANGRVYIVNPAGVYFGQSAVVDVNSLHAAAGAMTDRDFLGNIDRFTNAHGSVINQGMLRANAITLVGQQVGNFGQIVAPQGTVVLAAGQDVIVGQRDGNIVVRIPRSGTDGQTHVTNTGEINASGGRVAMVAGDLLGAAMYNSGRISGRDVRVEVQGIGTTTVSGTIDASNAAGAGGTVRVLGEHVHLDNATIDASGTAGGSIMVGGNFFGRGDEARSRTTTVDAGTTLRADGRTGDAGRVVAWSDGTTRFDGMIYARAQGDVGNGGVAEVSGKEHVAIGGHAQLEGKTGLGHFTIDPGSVSIVDGGNTAPGGALDTFNDGWIIDQMNTGGATLLISTGNSTNNAAQNLTVDAAANIAYNSANLLILDGGASVTVDGTITNSGQGGLALTGGAIAVNGAITVGGSMVTNGTSFANAGTINAGRDVTLTQTGAVNVNANITAGLAFNSANTGIGGTFDSSGFLIDANGGNINIAHAGDAVTIGAIDGSGAVIVSGANIVQAGTANASSYDMNATGLITVNAAVTVTGAAGFTADSAGFTSSGGGTITANNAAGLIDINSTAGNVTLGGALTAGTGGIDLSAASSSQILQNAAATTTGAYTAASSGQYQLGANVTGGSITIQAGASGTGNLDLNGNTLNANAISLRAGDGNGGGGDAAIVDISGNPTFANTAGTGRPSSVAIRQDASLADAGIADLARFQTGSIAGMDYSLRSDAGSVTLSTATKVNGTNLTLNGQTGVTLSSDLTLGALDVTGATTLSADLSTGIGAMTFHNAVALGAADRSLTGGGVTFTAGATSTGGGLQIANSGTLTVGGTIALTGAGVFNQSGIGAVALNAGVSTQNQNITFNGPINVGANVQIAAGTGTIDLNDDVDLDTRTLTLTGDEIDLAGAGSVTGTGGAIVFQPSANSVSIGIAGGAGTLDLSASDIAALGTGISSITIGRSGGTHAITANAATFTSATTIRGGTIAIDGQLTGTGNASFALQGDTTLNDDIVTDSRAISITGNVILGTGQATYLLDTTAASTGLGANISISGTTNGESAGARGLNLTAGTGDISLGNVGDTARLAFLRVNSTDDATFGTVDADFVLQAAGTGLTTFGDITAADAVNVSGTGFSFQDATVNGGFGFRVANTGTASFAGDLTLEGRFDQSGGGAVNLGGDITTTNDPVDFSGAVTLTAGSAITTTTGGTVTFASTVDGTHNLVIHTGSGDVVFTGDVGATAALDDISILTDNASFAGTVAADSLDVTAEGNISVADDMTIGSLSLLGGNDGVGNLLFTAPGITLAGDNIVLAVGDAAPGGFATLNLATNTPTFSGLAGGATSPDSLTLIQDAAFTDADLPDGSAFAGGLDGLTYTIESRDGNVVIADADKVNGTFLTVNGALGVSIQESLLLGSFLTDSNTALTGDIQTSGDLTINARLTLVGGPGRLNAGLSTITLGDVVAGANDLAVTADSLELNGSVSGTGILVLQPGSASRNIRLGGTSVGGSTFELTQVEIQRLANGWSDIFVGRNNGSGLLSLGGDTAFIDPVTLRMNGDGGRMDITSRLGGADNASLHLLSGGNITLYADVVTSGNAIELAGDVVLQTNARIDSTDNGLSAAGADISIRGLVDSAPSTSNALNITSGTGGSARLDQEVGLFHDLDSLTISGAGIALNKVTTANGQSYNGPVFLGGNLTSTTGGSILIADRVFLTADSDIVSAGAVGNNITITGGIDSLTLGSEKNVRLNSGFGNLSVSGNSGQNVRVAGFGATGANITTGGVRSTGNVIYNGLTSLGARIEGVIVSFNDALTLTGNTAIIATSSATFGDVVNSEVGVSSNLAVTSPVTTFVGAIGDIPTQELGVLTTSGNTNLNASAVRTNTRQSFGGSVQLNNDVTFASGADGIEFLGGINSDSAGTPRSIVLTTPGTMTLAGSIGNLNRLASITTGGGGTIRVAASVIRTTATQDYASAVIVDENTAFTGSAITFASTINSGADGPRSVAITTAGGAISLNGAVGGTAPLSQFNVTATSFTLPSVRTTGSQTYTGITTLTGDLSSSGSGDIAFSGVTRLANNITITTAGAAGDDVSFASALDAQDEPRSLTVNALLGDVTFGSNVGAGTGSTDRQLSSLSVTGGAIGLNTVQTSGSQYYGGTSTLRGSLTSTGTGSITLEGAAILGTNLILTTASGGIFVDATVNSDTTSRSLTLSSGGSSVKRLGGAIGATGQLSTITVNSDGTTVLAAPTIKTSGNQTYSGPVTLAGNVTIQSPTAITFVNSLDSDSVATTRSLVIDTTGGAATTSNITFGGAIGATPTGSGTSTLRLANLQVVGSTGSGTVRFSGNVLTTRGVDLFGPVKLLNSLTIDGGNGVLLFRNAIDTEVNSSPVNLTLLSTRSDLTPDRSPFRFGKSIGGSNAIANLTIGSDLASPYRTASIVFSDSFDTSGNILASGVAASDSFTITTTGNFLMGAGQKITSFGSLRINAGGSATLGDLVSIADITVTSNNIILRARPAATLYDNTFESPDAFQTDTGTDFVTAGAFTFSSAPTVIGSGNAPTFASNTGLPPTNLQGFGFRRFLGGVRTVLFTDTRAGGTNFFLPLDLRAFGASAAQLATSLAGALPRDVTPGEAVTPPPISSSMQSSLADMGIQTRSLTPDETIDYLVGNATYDDVRPRAGLVADDYRIASNRLTGPASRRAIDSYRALVSTPELDANGRPIVDASGNAVLRDRTGEIKAVLARAWESYATRAQNPSGVGFRAFLENRGAEATTTEVQALIDLNAILETLTSIRAIGLSEYESSIPRRKILAKIRPDSITDRQMVEAIFGAPMER